MGVKQKSKSLQSKGSLLSDTSFQLKVLSGQEAMTAHLTPFQKMLDVNDKGIIKSSKLEIFQINIGKLCNQTCSHCHVDAGPDRKEENMSRETLEQCLEVIKQVPSIHTVDITGGAPEMNPHFRWFVEEVSNLGKKVIDRCNLTIIMANKKYHDLPEFFKKHKVQVVSSLPYFSEKRTDSQRGDGVFNDSIAALQKLNAVGYGIEGTGLILDLVYNPSGAFLPSSQEQLQAEFKRQLKRKFDIDFNMLYAITNLPISRFLEYLLETNNYLDYMEKLINAFNPSTVDGLMCKNTLSISWDGYMYDCDFNQMLDLKVDAKSKHIKDFNLEELKDRTILVNQHCYGCTAGAGSSCSGEIS